MSFAEWTATSIRPASRASSISLTKTPREPISPNGFVRSLSPAVVIGTSAISTPSPRSRSAASSACVSARRLPRLPILRIIEAEQVANRVCVGRAVGAGGRLLQPYRRIVQQLVDDLHSHGLDGAALLRREVGESSPGPLQLAEANLLGARTQRCNRRDDTARGLPSAKALGLLRDDRLGAGRRTLDRAGADSFVEIVDVVEECVGKRGDLGIEVTWDREVDQKQRTALARRERLLDIVTRDQQATRVRRRQDDVGLGEGPR